MSISCNQHFTQTIEMNASHASLTKEEQQTNGCRFSESNQSAFRRISSLKSDSSDMSNEKSNENGPTIPSDELLTGKSTISNPFLPPLLSSSADFHSHLALLRPFLSQTLPFVPPLSSSTYWNTFPFLHPYLSGLRPPTYLPSAFSLSSLSSSSSSSPPLVPPAAAASASTASSSTPKTSSSIISDMKKPPSSATHYHQYTITNNNVLMPSPATLMDFIRRPNGSIRESSNPSATTANNLMPSKSKNLKKYKCDICSRAFSRSNTLVTHKRIHTGEKPFVCDICDRAFRQPGNLTRHKLTHTAAKPYACSICSKAFNRASNLHAHQRTHALILPMLNKPNANNKTSNGHSSYSCPHCPESFEHKFELNLHVAAIHHSIERSFSSTRNGNVEIDDDEEDEEDEPSLGKDEEMSDTSDQDIDLLEN